jgi:hypothetical protein
MDTIDEGAILLQTTKRRKKAVDGILIAGDGRVWIEECS